MKSAGLTAAVLTLAATTMAQSQYTLPLANLRTRPERTQFRETSRYLDVVAFMNAVAEAAPNTIRLTTFGKTQEGRALPLAVVGAPGVTPDDVRRTGKLRVYIQGNIHGGEVEGKESAQILLREFAEGKHADWLRSMVFLIAPIFNADGNERIAPNNRGPQHGPIEGSGQRPNAQGYDLNRDHIKLDSPEARSLIKLLAEYDPHVSIDLHTTNGSYHAYHLTYAPPLNPNTSEAIVTLLKNEWFPSVTKAIKAKHGWDYFYYGNVDNPPSTGSDQARQWATFEHVPRFNNNYVGMRNRFGILSEAYSYATFDDRIKATSWFLEETLTFGHENASRIRAATEAADRDRLVGTTLSTRSRHHRGGMIEVLMGEVEREVNPISGGEMLRRKSVSRPEPMVDVTTFEPSATEVVPSEYYVPAEAAKAIDLLRAHGIEIRTLTGGITGVEQFIVDSQQTQSFQQHDMRMLEGRWQPAPDVVVPPGTIAVPMNQRLARLAFYLLEPASDDGLTNWNFFDDALEGAKVHPVLRRR